MHIVGSRTMRRALQAVLLRPAEGVSRTLGLSRLRRVLRRPVPRPMPWTGPPQQAELGAAEWLWLQRACSERGGRFFSPNLVSNESSYLQPAAELVALPKGLGYVGVGPEQTFSYLAMLEPSLAFVLDLRPDNARLHWLYKGLFLAAPSRAEWLALLLGRPGSAAGADALGETSPDEIVRSVELLRPSEEAFASAHAKVRQHLTAAGCPVSRRDEQRLLALHRTFARHGLELRFALHGPSRHGYPTLRSTLLARSPNGLVGSFLGHEGAYATVRRLQQQNRVVPIIGDLAGEHALPCVARELRRLGLEVGVAYVSNVEQYLFEQRKWRWWIENLARLPLGRQSLVVRSYLDQGRRHPLQMPGHRITSVAQLALPLLERERARGYDSYWQVATDLELRPRGRP